MLTYEPTKRPKLAVVEVANGGTLSWGYTDVPAGDTKTITVKNDGTADLDVTIAATDDYTVDPASKSMAEKVSNSEKVVPSVEV